MFYMITTSTHPELAISFLQKRILFWLRKDSTLTKAGVVIK
jgi:hypothetical protein